MLILMMLTRGVKEVVNMMIIVMLTTRCQTFLLGLCFAVFFTKDCIYGWNNNHHEQSKTDHTFEE